MKNKLFAFSDMIAIPGGNLVVDIGKETFKIAPSFYKPINSFEYSKYEVTYDLWYQVYHWATHPDRGNKTYSFANPGTEGGTYDGKRLSPPATKSVAPSQERKFEPVTGISWRDTLVWCNAYSEMTGLEPVYYLQGTKQFKENAQAVLRLSEPSQFDDREKGKGTGEGSAEKAVVNSEATGFRLPSESEWEYTARLGHPDLAKKTALPDLEVLHDYAWFAENSHVDGIWKTHPVGNKQADKMGLHDLLGNVWEWCIKDPLAPGAGQVSRGGSWDDAPRFLKIERRIINPPYYINTAMGFRVAKNCFKAPEKPKSTEIIRELPWK